MGKSGKDVPTKKRMKEKLYLCISKAALGHLSIYVHGVRWHLLCISKGRRNKIPYLIYNKVG